MPLIFCAVFICYNVVAGVQRKRYYLHNFEMNTASPDLGTRPTQGWQGCIASLLRFDQPNCVLWVGMLLFVRVADDEQGIVAFQAFLLNNLLYRSG